MGLLFNIETCYKRNRPKIGCFASFCHHCLIAMSAHIRSMHVYHHSLFESGMKTGLRMITLCKKDRVLLSKHKYCITNVK